MSNEPGRAIAVIRALAITLVIYIYIYIYIYIHIQYHQRLCRDEFGCGSRDGICDREWVPYLAESSSSTCSPFFKHTEASLHSLNSEPSVKVASSWGKDK